MLSPTDMYTYGMRCQGTAQRSLGSGKCVNNPGRLAGPVMPRRAPNTYAAHELHFAKRHGCQGGHDTRKGGQGHTHESQTLTLVTAHSVASVEVHPVLLNTE